MPLDSSRGLELRANLFLCKELCRVQAQLQPDNHFLFSSASIGPFKVTTWGLSPLPVSPLEESKSELGLKSSRLRGEEKVFAHLHL